MHFSRLKMLSNNLEEGDGVDSLHISFAHLQDLERGENPTPPSGLALHAECNSDKHENQKVDPNSDPP
jgi:hypothetical protein